MADIRLSVLSPLLWTAILMIVNGTSCQIWSYDDDEFQNECNYPECDDNSQMFIEDYGEAYLPDDGERDQGFSETTSEFGLDRNSWEYHILHKTIFAEARAEPELGQRAVAWVIKNRADQNQPYWGGNTIVGVCLQPFQFECWNPDRSHLIDEAIRSEPEAFNAMDTWLPEVYLNPDPTDGADHYNNPDKEGYPPWTNNVDPVIKIGNHQFYKSK
ncbi:hypothetical protein GHT06_016511 [Daphnia sinensis]|uniref:Cell wall hydrolase SleB domain-containing protein n=1 Tax=Daphnia sinensis TaxID=1820382 RepID=A0AAD5L5T4_9CRUS|nr:hypothetical protein GHT06_016511 [Daphnia sinensis]